MDKIKAVGDIAMQHDPAHLASPWAAIRFCLQATVNDVQTFGAILEGFEIVIRIIARYAVFERLYLLNSSMNVQLSVALVDMYTTIFVFRAKCSGYFGRNAAIRLAKSVSRQQKLILA